MYTDRTSDQVIERMLAKLVASTDVTVTTPGGMARTLIEIVGAELGDAYLAMTQSLQQAFVSTATGIALDRLGAIFGLTRKTVDPVIYAEVGAVFFYLTKVDEDVVAGTATQYATADIVIPKGTVIGASTRLSSDDRDLFKTTENVTISAGSYMAYASVEPFNSVRQTMPGGSLLYHSFTPEVTPVNTQSDDLEVKVFNRSELQSSTTDESDSNFRYRIVNAMAGNAGSTVTALRLAALGTTGVRDCIVVPHAHGVGTAKVIVVLENPAGSNATSIFATATTNIDQKTSVGDIIDVARAIEIPLDMTIMLTFKDGLQDAELMARAVVAAKTYINSLSVGDTFSVSKLYGILTSISPRITSARILDGSMAINGVTPDAVDGTRVSVTDYTCTNEEQLYAADIFVVAA